MNKYALKNGRGMFYVLGRGFTATTQADAAPLTAEQLENLNLDGVCGEEIEIPQFKSFGVNYIRASDLDGTTVMPNTKNPSRRRFATRGEANMHGSRFAHRRAKSGDKAGTAGHIGYYVTETNDPVNATVNLVTGLTNPIV